jgi:RimJ/RimL family protein N-acetyltransferase
MTAFIETERLLLDGLRTVDASAEYLAWLNDPEVLRFRGPRGFPSSMDELRAYLERAEGGPDLVLAIRLRSDGGHIGNIALNTIDWLHSTAEVSMMIGAREQWNQGFGKEAIVAVTKHAFATLGLNRLWAESPNPSFNAAVAALGWTHEGTKRQAFRLDGRFVDIECFGLLASEHVAAPHAP